MAEELFEVEIFCDGPGCQTTTRHVVWATSERQAFGKARVELIRNHRWVRALMRSNGQPPHPVDLCPNCKTHLKKEPAHA